MISAMITGRIVKVAHMTDDGSCEATITSYAGNQSIRLSCTRNSITERLLELPFGSPLAASGLLSVVPVINHKGEPRAHLTLKVSAILIPPKHQRMIDRLFNRGNNDE